MKLIPTASASLRWLLVLSLSLSPTPALAKRDELLPHPDYVQRTLFDAPLGPFYFFDDSEIVLVMDRDANVYRSVDAGAEWEPVKAVTKHRAHTVHRHPVDNNVAIILGKRREHWYTRDKGDTWTSFKTDEHPTRANPVSFHADDSKKVIVNVGLNREHFAVYTDNGFKSKPKVLRKGAVQCMWAKEKQQLSTGGDEEDENRVLCLVDGPGYRPSAADRRLLYSDDYFDRDNEPKVEGDHTKRGFVSMVSATKFIYAARKAEDSMEMALHVTTDGRTWHRALFGKQKLEADGFTVMEGTNYSARVDVLDAGGRFRASPMGSLYSSNSNGTYFTAMEGYTNRNDYGFVDFEGLDAIQGVALANIIANPDEVREGGDKEVKSQITFDDGRTWQELLGTKWDKKGQPLHLHSYSELRNQGKVFSNKGAPGLVMGVGNVGGGLSPYKEGDLWVSIDGGQTFSGWLAGAHKYEFGDSGAMLCAVYDEDRVDEVMWSTDYGSHWEGFKLVEASEEDPSMVPGVLTTIPDSTSSKFLLQATTNVRGKTKFWVYSIDLSFWETEKKLPKCKDKDFETWHARETEDGKPGCIMGHTQSFRRRKPDSECVVGHEFEEALPETEDCDCAEADFECDAEYERTKDRKSCVPIAGTAPRGACDKDDDTFKAASGFRKIPGNTCKDNDVSKKMLGEVERSCKDTKGKKPAADGEIKSTQHDFEAGDFRDYRYLERSSTTVEDDDEEVLMMVTKGDRKLWTSRDHGKSWKEVEALKGEEVVEIIPNPFEHQDAYFTTPSKRVYFTQDRGLTFESFEVPVLPSDSRVPTLSFHEKHSRWLIFAGCGEKSRLSERCQTTAYSSTKQGLDWEPLLKNVGSCEFVWQESRNVSVETVYCSEEQKSGRALLSSEDGFKESVTLFDNIVSYATMDEFIVVATHDAEDPDNLMLNSSVDATNFAAARFPPTMHVKHNGYTVLDSATNSIFAHATVNSMRGQEYGNIIKSNSNGTNFVNSLDNVNRNREGFVDFEKLHGIEGAALANVVWNPEEVNDGKRKAKKTRITHNDGADWASIQAAKDMDGNPPDCDGKRPQCELHLHGYTERKKPEESYSSPSAIGMIIGVGNVGEYLGDYSDADTFISRDGGINWQTAQKGQYMWEFGDQGSLIVLAPDNTPTDTIKYSTDEGATFNDYKFTKGDVKVVIKDLTTIPSDASMMFLLWAHRTGSRKNAVTFNIDFSGIFERQCKLDDQDKDKSDYYHWAPKHPLSDGDCLFGHVKEYHRKKASSEKCYNGPNWDKFHAITKHCECNTRDFECDYNFERDRDGTCKLVGEMPDPKQQCYDNPEQVEYYETIGYRRIPGDTCEGGREYDKVGAAMACPKHEEEFSKKHGTSGWVIALAVILSVGVAAGIGYFFWTRYGSQFGRIQLGDSLSRQSPSFDLDSAWLRYPVVAVSAVAAGLMALPMVAVSAARWIGEKLGRRSRGAYSSLDRTYTSRRSFARGRGDYAAVGANVESDLLGEESDEDA